MMGLGKKGTVIPFKQWQFLVSMLDFYRFLGCNPPPLASN